MIQTCCNATKCCANALLSVLTEPRVIALSDREVFPVVFHCPFPSAPWDVFALAVSDDDMDSRVACVFS